MISELKHLVRNRIFSFRQKRIALTSQRHEILNSLRGGVVTPLSSEEKIYVKSKWGRICPFPKQAYPELELFKFFRGSIEDICPLIVFNPYILWELNPRNEEATIRDKGILDVIWDSKKTPPLLAKNIRGAFLSKDSRLITMKQAIQTIMEAETDIVIKPSINSCCGRGVQILKKDVLSAKNLDTVLKGFNSDFVIQEKIQQSEETAKYNPTSLNTFRVTSLLINGEFSIPMINFKIGADGKEVDNIGGGNGGTMTGVDLRTGALSLGMNSNFEIIEERGGSKLNECCISALDKIKEFTKELHLRIPMMRFVGWDIALNKDNTPILIEANVNYPGIEFEQLLSGPCFGKRTQEVIEYIQERIKRRNE